MPEVSAQQVMQAIAPLISRSGTDVIGEDMPLLSSGVIDSMGIAELGQLLSDAFGVDVSIDQLGFDNADTPAQLAVIVSQANSNS